MYEILVEKFEKEELDCLKIARKLVSRYEKINPKCDGLNVEEENQFLNDPKIHEFLKILKFFSDYNLLDNATDRFNRVSRQFENMQN